jgi:hypothetical protein
MFSLSALSSLHAGCARTLEMRFLTRSFVRSPCCFIVPRAGRSRARMIGKRVHVLFTAFIDDQGASRISVRRVCMHDLGASSHQLSRIPECSSQRASLFCFSPTSCSARVARGRYECALICMCVCGCMEMEEKRTPSLTHLLACAVYY